MRLFSILTAIVVVVALYFVIFERESLLEFAGTGSAAQASEDVEGAVETTEETDAEEISGVSVVAMRSEARVVDGAVILRGRTEASRQVELRAETNGQIISEPARRGTEVAEGDLLCVLDPGTRQNRTG